jgi:hypothetical protein
MAENTSTSMENAALKLRIATLEKADPTTTTSGVQPKTDFHIYEDMKKEATLEQKQFEAVAEASFAPSFNATSSGKENSTTPKSRRTRRGTVPDIAGRTIASSRLGGGKDEASIILGKSPGPVESNAPSWEPPQSARPSRTPLSARRAGRTQEKVDPSSPFPVLPSSPLPMPSPDQPDPWMNMDESSISQLDKKAMPTAGAPYVNPAWNPPAKQHRVSKSKSDPQGIRQQMRMADTKASTHKEELGLEARLAALSTKSTKTKEKENFASGTASLSPPDPKFDVSKITSHHAEGSAKVKHDRAEMVPVDRKAEARRRLQERKKLRKAAPV